MHNNAVNDSDTDNDAIILPPHPQFQWESSYRVCSTKQEDDSGVNHLWKGEMWPARVSLIHARHVQNTRGAGANNWSSCQWAAVISFDILIVSQSEGNFGNIAVSPRTCPIQLTSVRGLLGSGAALPPWLRDYVFGMCVSSLSSISEGNRAWLLPFPLTLEVWVGGAG